MRVPIEEVGRRIPFFLKALKPFVSLHPDVQAKHFLCGVERANFPLACTFPRTSEPRMVRISRNVLPCVSNKLRVFNKLSRFDSPRRHKSNWRVINTLWTVMCIACTETHRE